MSQETRPSLLLRIRRSGDHAAWCEFVSIYAPFIYSYARKRELQDADAADLVQEVLETVAGKITQWDYQPARGTFRGWLCTITLNKIRDWATKKRPAAEGTGRTTVHQMLAERSNESSEEEEAFERDRKWYLFTWAAEKAKVDFREQTFDAFWKAAVENQPAKEVAQQLGISTGAVHIAKSRVLAKIREILQDVEEDDGY